MSEEPIKCTKMYITNKKMQQRLNNEYRIEPENKTRFLYPKIKFFWKVLSRCVMYNVNIFIQHMMKYCFDEVKTLPAIRHKL